MKQPWAHTSLSAFRNCPKQYYHKYVLKDIPFVKSPEMERGIAVHQAMERRLRDNVPLPIDMPFERFVAPLVKHAPPRIEYKIAVRLDGSGCGYWDKDVWGRGAIDVACIGPTTAMIVDWKTGKPREDPAELETFSFLLQGHFPGMNEFYGLYVWLKDGRAGETHKLDPAKARKDIEKTVNEIEHCESKEAWHPQPSGLCPWCPVTTCQHWRPR